MAQLATVQRSEARPGGVPVASRRQNHHSRPPSTDYHNSLGLISSLTKLRPIHKGGLLMAANTGYEFLGTVADAGSAVIAALISLTMVVTLVQ